MASMDKFSKGEALMLANRNFFKKIEEAPLDLIEDFDPAERGIVKGELDVLKASIRDKGLMHPVILRGFKDKSCKIIAGYKRVLCFKDLQKDSIKASILTDECRDGAEILLTAISENATHRRINPLEAYCYIKTLSDEHGFDDVKIIEELFPVMNWEESAKLLMMARSITNLDGELKRLVAAKSLSLKDVFKLSLLGERDRKDLGKFALQGDFNINKFREILDVTMEVMQREGLSVAQILPLDIFKESVNKEDRYLVSERLRKLLKQLRNPKISKLEDGIRNMIGKLDLPEGIEILPPKDFDDGKFRVAMEFDTVGDLKNKISRFDLELEKGSLEELVEAF